jgi:hypothetical protein
MMLFAAESKPHPRRFLEWCEAKLSQVMDSGNGFTSTLAHQIKLAWRCALEGDAHAWFEIDGSRLHDLIQRFVQSFPSSGTHPNRDEQLLAELLMEERRWITGAFHWSHLLRQPAASAGKRKQRRSNPYIPSEWDRALLQYLRIRNLYHRHLTVYERGSGFEYFYEVFRRGSPVVKRLLNSDPRALGIVFEHLDPLHQIDRVEFRHPTRIEDARAIPPDNCLYSIESFEARLRGLDALENCGRVFPRRGGLIFHFNKKTQVDDKDSVLRSATRQLVNGKWRLGKEFAALLEEAQSLCTLWCRGPIHYWIVGFDVAGVESFSPNWPFLAVLRKLRQVIGRESAKRPTEPKPGFTFHAGECFHLVVAGLHRVGQVIDFLGENPAGGRIGHGLALSPFETSRGHQSGESNEAWAMSLCWARHRLQTHSRWLDEQANQVVREIRSCVKPARGSNLPKWMQEVVQHIDVDLLSGAYQRFGEPSTLTRIGFPFDSPGNPPETDYDRLAGALLFSSSYQEWAKKTDVARDDAPDELLDQLRSLLREKTAALGLNSIPITIEACPTSNLAIGVRQGTWSSHFAGYPEHPSLKMYCSDSSQSPWHVSLNTDNPLTFGIDLRQEYLRMHRAASAPPAASSNRPNPISCDAWLTARRRDGASFCFIPEDGGQRPYTELWQTLRQAAADTDFQAGLEARTPRDWWKQHS